MLAEKIKRLRESRHMSQAELARRLGVTRSSVNSWEMGLACPKPEYLAGMAKMFHVSTDYLLNLPDNNHLDISMLSEDEVSILSRLVSYFQESKNLSQKDA